MKTDVPDRQRSLYLVAAAVLLVGLGAAIPIYLLAEDDPGVALGYVIVDGKSYPIRPEDSKVYRHELERYGGKWNVVADELTRWFGGLWRGKALALTVACISVVAAFGFFWSARRINFGGRSDGDDRQ